MPTGRADRPRSMVARAPLLALLAVIVGASGCAVRTGPPTTPSATAPATVPGAVDAQSAPAEVEVEGVVVPPDLDAAFSKILYTRARAVLEHDRVTYMSVLDRENEGFLVAQRGYFDNLAQLPLAVFDYSVDSSSLVRGRASYSVVVEIKTQISGFDAVPARTLDRFRFDAVGRPADRSYRLASVTDRAWEDKHDIRPQPWEVVPVQVRHGAGVLAIFDDAAVGAARPLLRSLEAAISDVAGRVPYEWDADVVVYALSDTWFIRSLDDLPGDDPEDLDAVAFTVPAGPGDSRIAATRIAFNPRVLSQTGAARERLLRHEMTHVAVGLRDDNAPVWLAEGLAEWVSVQAMPERKRRVDAEALEAARRGVDSMPDDETFNDANASLNYATAWWVCEYLATTFGDTAPWVVLDAFAAPGTPESPTIQALLQISADKLAKRGVALLVSTYASGPSSSRTGDVTATPGDEPDAG